LIAKVANINIQNDDGETLLYQICKQKNEIDEEKKEKN